VKPRAKRVSALRQKVGGLLDREEDYVKTLNFKEKYSEK
jgi:hypothetical protein